MVALASAWALLYSALILRQSGSLGYPRSRCLPTYLKCTGQYERAQRHSQTQSGSSPYETLDRALREWGETQDSRVDDLLEMCCPCFLGRRSRRATRGLARFSEISVPRRTMYLVRDLPLISRILIDGLR